MATTITAIKDAFTDYDPNKSGAQQPKWGVYMHNKGYRGSKFQTYSQRGHAINAFNFHGRTKLYLFDGGAWVELAVKDSTNPKDICDLCGRTTHGVDAYGVQCNLAVFAWKRTSAKISDPPKLYCVCRDCERQHPEIAWR